MLRGKDMLDADSLDYGDSGFMVRVYMETKKKRSDQEDSKAPYEALEGFYIIVGFGWFWSPRRCVVAGGHDILNRKVAMDI